MEARIPAAGHDVIGRDRELEQITTLLMESSDRLITLVGEGGIGKTRLAAEAVRRLRCDEGAQVFWVRLAGLATDAERTDIERCAAAAAVETDFSDRDTMESLIGRLGHGDPYRANRVVLVLDNCEHVRTGVRYLITELLESLPRLTILATSRRAIGWVDEHLIMVPPLRRTAASALFQQRAELAGRHLDGTGNEAVVTEICRHVHHHPLYIQLAAARLRRIPLTRVRDELTGRADDQRLRWNTEPRAGAEQRHHAVPDVIAWSYDLCAEPERLLFDRLSVFAAGSADHPAEHTDEAADIGADPEAIRAVCADERLPAEDVEDLLSRLADHSLITVHITTTTVRFSLLESMRLFAADRLAERGADEPTRLARRHLHHYRDRVTHAAATWFGPAEHDILDWARAAWANIVTAIETAITTPADATAGLEICLGLIALRIPFVRGTIREIRQWTDRCLDATRATTPQPAELRLSARSALAWLAVRQGRSEEATRLLDNCVGAQLPGIATDWRSRPDHDLGLPALLDLAWGTELFMADRDSRAITVLLRARDKFHHGGEHGTEVFAGMFAGLAAALLGSSEQARTISRNTLDHARGSGARWAASWAELSWAVTLIRHGDPLEAAHVLRHTLTEQLAIRDRWGAAWSVELRTWALAHAITGRHRERDTHLAVEIAHLAGGARTLRATLGVDIERMGTFADQSRRATATARHVLGETAFAAEFRRGTELRPEHNDVHRLALGELTLEPLGGTACTGADTGRWDLLTPTEQQVALLAAAGHTNAHIAARRHRSVRTIDRQVSAILRTLQISSRDRIGYHVPTPLRRQLRAESRHAILPGRPGGLPA